MNLFAEFRNAVIDAVSGLVAAGTLPEGLDTTAVTVEPPRDPAHGDIATNAALVLAKPARANPRAIAEALAERLKGLPAVTAVEIAGPGFLNLRLAAAFWQDRLRDILVAGVAYGQSTMGAGSKVDVEYVSANPTGPLHVGHCRGAVYGDALAALLQKAGYDVCREYYINDAGAQVDVLARSAHLRYREALGDEIGEIPAGLYPGDYLKPVGQALAAKYGDRYRALPESEWLVIFRDETVAAMLDLIRDDLKALNIVHEVFSSERALHVGCKIDEAVAALQAQDLVYTGVLEPPKGKTPEDWEPRPQLLFRAAQFGDDTDRPLKKSDGAWTYFAADIAYHYDKYRRGFADQINVWGADHGGYVKRTRAALVATSGGRATLDVKLCQMVNLLDGGVPVKMSKRAGRFVTLRDIVDEVGPDVTRFIMLTRKNDAPLDFDFQKVTEQSKDNPVFYVQYAHARCHSLFRQAGIAPAEVAGADVSRLGHPGELALIRLLASWPRQVEIAALAHEPHRIAFFLQEVAAAFHAFWNLGNDDVGLRFVIAGDDAMTRARLALAQGVATVIASGLGVMGVTPVEELRS
jgi:arginyl-tRNA synthetase